MSLNITELWTSGELKQKKKIQKLGLPSGIGFDKQNDKVRTNRVDALFLSTPLISKGIEELKNGEPIPMNQFSVSVTWTGLNIPKSAALKILQTKKRSSKSLAFFLSKYLFVTANGNISNFLDGLNSILTYKNSKKCSQK
jgi:hypothetical protein